MRKAALFIAIAVLVVSGLCFHRRLYQNDEKRIKAIIEEMEAAAEAKSADGIIKWFANDYQDGSGNTKFFIYQLIRRTLERVEEMRVEVTEVEVLVTGDRAWATVTVTTEAIRGGSIVFPFGSDQEPETPRITFKRTATGDWRITRVEDVKTRGL